MKDFLIRHSTLADLPVLMELYRESREIMDYIEGKRDYMEITKEYRDNR